MPEQPPVRSLQGGRRSPPPPSLPSPLPTPTGTRPDPAAPRSGNLKTLPRKLSTAPTGEAGLRRNHGRQNLLPVQSRLPSLCTTATGHPVRKGATLGLPPPRKAPGKEETMLTEIPMSMRKADLTNLIIAIMLIIQLPRLTKVNLKCHSMLTRVSAEATKL